MSGEQPIVKVPDISQSLQQQPQGITNQCQTPTQLQTRYPNLGVVPDITNNALNADGICGQNYYIVREPTTLCPIGCAPCNTNKPSYASDMCNQDKNIWWHAQKDANINRRPINVWTKVNTVLSVNQTRLQPGEEKSALDIAKEWYINRMDDKQLINRMFALKWKPSVGELPDKKDYDKGIQSAIDKVRIALDQFKIAISDGRGSSVTCIEPVNKKISLNGTELIDLGNTWNKDEIIGGTGSNQKKWENCSTTGKFGPNNISTREYEEWSADYLRQSDSKNNILRDSSGTIISDSSTTGDVSSNIIGAELFPISRPFENCINKLLNEYDNGGDTELINEINSIRNIRHLEHKHMEFIKRKLELLLISKSRVSVKDCMLKHIFKDKNDCPDNLPQQMMIIMNILFSTIGFNLQLNNLDHHNKHERKKLTKLIDHLGDLIPRAIAKIIDITEEIELHSCGEITDNTQILKEMNDKLFNPQKKTVQFDMGLPSVSEVIKMTDIDKILDKNEVNDDQFQRLTILGAIAIAVLKFI